MILPPRHPLLTLRSVALELLAAEPFILPPAGLADGFVARITQLCAEADFRPRVSHQAHQLSTTAEKLLPPSSPRHAAESVRSSHQITLTPAASRSPYALCGGLPLFGPSCRMVTDCARGRERKNQLFIWC